jgi:acyl-ACP thioesterase
MRPVSIFKKNYRIELRDVDLTKKLKLSALFNYMQEISSLHVENLGTGIEAIEKRCGVTWILMRAKAEIKISFLERRYYNRDLAAKTEKF